MAFHFEPLFGHPVLPFWRLGVLSTTQLETYRSCTVTTVALTLLPNCDDHHADGMFLEHRLPKGAKDIPVRAHKYWGSPWDDETRSLLGAFEFRAGAKKGLSCSRPFNSRALPPLETRGADLDGKHFV